MTGTDETRDVARPPGEDAWFRARVAELEGAIRRVVTQEADDLCWMDVYTQLAALVGVTFDPRMIPRDRMLANCERFVDSLIGGCPYAVDATTAELASLRARVAELEAERDRLRRRTHEIQGRADRVRADLLRELRRVRWAYDYARRWLGSRYGLEGIGTKGARSVEDIFAVLLRERSEAKTALGMARKRVAELEAERDRRPARDGIPGPVPFAPEGRAEWGRVLEACRAAWAEDPDDEPDPATLARAAGLGDGFDETAPDPALAGWADDDWEARP